MKIEKNSTNKLVSPLSEEEIAAIRQQAHYSNSGKAEPDNNIFFEERSNPLSSKGN